MNLVIVQCSSGSAWPCAARSAAPHSRFFSNTPRQVLFNSTCYTQQSNRNDAEVAGARHCCGPTPLCSPPPAPLSSLMAVGSPSKCLTLRTLMFITFLHFSRNCGRGSAVLWAHPRVQPTTRPLVVSHGSGHGFASDFMWDGCRDYAPYLGVSAALRMWRALGHDRCRWVLGELLNVECGKY